MSALLAVVCFSLSAHAGPWIPAPGEYYSELRGSLFSADTYDDQDGTRLQLGGKWEQRSGQWSTELGWKKRLSFLFSVPFTSVTLQRDANPFYSATNTGLADVTLGMRFALKKQTASALALELDWSAPLGYRKGQYFATDQTDSGAWAPLNYARRFSRLGDSRQSLGLTLQYGTAFTRRGFLQLSAGAQRRFLSIRSSAPPPVALSQPDVVVADPLQTAANFATASADLAFWVRPSLLVGGRYQGKMLASTNGVKDFELERNLHLAGPFVLWRVDERLDLSAGTWSTASAKNALHYDQFYVALAFKQTKLNRLQGFLGGTKAP
ncbi:MAG TPA: transporter [Terriglobales bacterium]|nr:transporter [Terriglobales bacterium]